MLSPCDFSLNLAEKCDSIVKLMEKYMTAALKEAQSAAAAGEVPVGAVIEKDGEIIARAHNLTETLKDPTAHAEMLAIRQAAEYCGYSRLCGCNMYVTLEPCSMCAGAIVWARIDKVIIGTMDPKAGACGSVTNIVQNEKLNHRAQVESGIMQEECSRILKDFFAERRKKQQKEK
jgi:tRNA(adenine34) deaminase